MDIEKLIEQLRTDSLYADKASLEIMDLCMAAATALSTLQIENQALRNAANSFKAENEKLRGRNTKLEDMIRSQRNGLQELRAELEQVKRERRIIPKGYALVKLKLLEELDNFRELGPIGRLRELKQADDEGRCVMLPAAPDQTIYRWRKGDDCPSVIRLDGVQISGDGEITYPIWCGHLTPGDFGKTVFLTREEAEAALRREQDD